MSRSIVPTRRRRTGSVGNALQPIGPAEKRGEWKCACGVEWETLEIEGRPSSRHINSVYRHYGAPLSSWPVSVYSAGHWPVPSPPSVADPVPPKPTPASEPEKTIRGSVIGYRAWRIQNWQLYGTGVNRAWTPGVNKATCDAGSGVLAFRVPNSHPAPSLGCDCGITALARFAERDDHWSNVDVHGAIEAWSEETDDDPGGRFILHGTGFRAQYGKIVLLAIEDDWPVAKKGAIRGLAAEHEADVCKRSHLEDAAKEHGQLVPDDMLEWAKDDGHIDVRIAGNGLAHLRAMNQIQQLMGISATAAALRMQASTIRPPKPAKKKRHGPKPPAGISQTLGYPGPPQGRLTAYRKGQHVRDRAGDIWQCVKGGKPGIWEPATA